MLQSLFIATWWCYNIGNNDDKDKDDIDQYDKLGDPVDDDLKKNTNNDDDRLDEDPRFKFWHVLKSYARIVLEMFFVKCHLPSFCG